MVGSIPLTPNNSTPVPPGFITVRKYNVIPSENDFVKDVLYINNTMSEVKSKVENVRFENSDLKIGPVTVTTKDMLQKILKSGDSDHDYVGLALEYCRFCDQFYFDKKVHKNLREHKIAQETIELLEGKKMLEIHTNFLF